MKSFLYLLLTATCFFAVSCKRHSSCISSGGGTGGTGSISVSPTHAGIYIDSCMVYIKYGTLNEPDNGIYDDSQACKLSPPDTIPVATFTNLKAGIYYIYGNGYHAGYSQPYIKGATNYTMCTQQTISIYLPTYSYNP